MQSRPLSAGSSHETHKAVAGASAWMVTNQAGLRVTVEPSRKTLGPLDWLWTSPAKRSRGVPRHVPGPVTPFNATIAVWSRADLFDGAIVSSALLACELGSITACSAEPDAEECGEGDKRQKAV